MNFLSNAHTHSTWCDGKASIPRMIEAAKALGFVSLGFSGHAAQGFDFDYSMSAENQSAYFEELHRLQAQRPANGLRLWAGLELDVLATDKHRREAFAQADYIIGSAHYLCADWQGQSVAVDGEPRLLKRYCKAAFDGDGLALAHAYYETVVSGLLCERPQIIGHFDLVRKYAASLKLFDETASEYRTLALDMLERAYPSGAVLEVNTGGMARGYLPMPYPTPELLGVWRELGGRITITSDCHDSRHLSHGFDTALQLARDAGYKTVLRLGTGHELWEEQAI